MPKVVIESKMYHYAAGVPPQNNIQCAIVFIHGAGGSHKHWAYQTTALGKKFLTIAVDLPGHGNSEGKPYNKIEGYADFIFDLTERVLGTKFVIAGHSMGGAIAMDFALRYPTKLNGLILIGTGARLRVASAILDTFAAGKLFPDLVNYAYSEAASPELIKQAKWEMENTDPSIYYNDFMACDGFNYMERVQAINTPTLVLGGAADRLTPPKYSQYLADNIPNSQLEIIEQAGHMIMLENPQQTNTCIEHFITSMASTV
ncbi:alpha/beta fold hydrolase [Desulfoscipio gibsoniae]|uniref:Putative hydrolase or acyltransferase of alpha/beta superfamily n=1 Tax=Desulfoscipio gibsoniae DSM 7213 TaxID=767817 RepID=R4KFQ3_9FIRM|nr:alpha/beta hydrolase [Desulfoscipio gibsoniae]AGL01434.1 putative hydrolase or acyltransferase of alpha/beta superfamily [Desulfoscipio gibsoniae DSM 7213]